VPKRGLNTRLGGHPRTVRERGIVANPQGSREERRAAARLARKASPRPVCLSLPAEPGPAHGPVGADAQRGSQGVGGGGR